MISTVLTPIFGENSSSEVLTVLRHYFILGPSGVGKTTLGDFIADHQKYLHLRIDTGVAGEDGIDVERLRKQWDILLRTGNFDPLVQELDKRALDAEKVGCILTFSSCLIFSKEGIALAESNNVLVRYLYGPRDKCIEAFISREVKNGHPERDENFWLQVNPYYHDIGQPAFARYRIQVFDNFGNHLSCKEVAELMGVN